MRFFLFRISSQIWRFSQKLRFSFLKGFQAKKGLVLHVLCPSHPCASLARTVLKPLSFLLWKWKWKWSEVIPFRSFFFPETNICYISCTYLYCYMGEKVHNNYLMGLVFSTSWRVAPTKIKFLMGIWIFQKRFQK